MQGTWLDPALDDAHGDWFGATTGIGYVPPSDPVVLADSVAEFSGVQGQNNWRYGTWNRSNDADGVYGQGDFGELNAAAFFSVANNRWDMGTLANTETQRARAVIRVREM